MTTNSNLISSSWPFIHLVGILNIDDEWDDDDLPEVAESTLTLLHMLGSSCTCRRESTWKPLLWRPEVNLSKLTHIFTP